MAGGERGYLSFEKRIYIPGKKKKKSQMRFGKEEKAGKLTSLRKGKTLLSSKEESLRKSF